MQKMKLIKLATLNRGAMADLFDLEFNKVIANIDDENTRPNDVREITIKLRIKPDKTRKTAETAISVTSRLSPVKPVESFMFFDHTENGFEAFEDDPSPELEFSGEAISFERAVATAGGK